MSAAVAESGTAHAERLLALEECDAWFEYRESCVLARSAASSVRYDEVEPWAWNRLRAKLRTVEARRRALRRDA